MERTQGTDGAAPRPPGWYPDPRDARRRRYWDGDRWSELSAAADAGVTTPGGAGPAEPTGSGDTSPPRDARRALVIGAVVVVVLLLGAVAWAVLGGGDDDRTASPADTSAPTSAPAGSGSEDTAPAPSEPTTAPVPPEDGATSTTTGGTTPTDAAGPGEPCEVDPAVLLGLLKAHPPLASFADGLTVDRTRCVGDWASAIVAAPDADRALALFRRDGDGWTLVLLGSAEPCSGLGIPVADEPTLGCGEW